MNQQNSTLLITGMAHGLVHLLMLALPFITAKLLLISPVLPGQEGLVVLLLNAPAYFFFGLGAIPAGILCDRVGPRQTIALGLLLSVVSGIALFFLWPMGWGVIALLFVVYSFGAGLYHPAGTTWVSNTFEENRGKALGRHGIGGSIGQALAPLISAVILSTVFWPVIFLFLAAIGFVIAFVCLRVRFETRTDTVEPDKPVRSRDRFFSVITPAALVLASIVFITRGMLYRGTVTALPVYITSELQALLVLAGFLGTLIYVSGAVGQEVGGRLTDNVGWRKTLIVTTILSGIALVFLAIPYSPTLFNDALLLTAILLFGFSFFSAQAANNTMVSELSTPSNRGVVFGWSFFTRFGMGAFGILIVGLGQIVYGTWTIGFLAMALLSIIAVICVPFIQIKNKSKKNLE